MKYISTRGQVDAIEFLDAVMMGLADDGGLIVPAEIPDVTGRLDRWRGLSYVDLAFEVMRLFATDVPAADLRTLIERAYGETFDGGVAPVVRVGERFVLELWHGPTLSFKDVALQMLGNLFEYVLSRRGGRLNILAATSGDTGSAATCGVRGRRGIDIFVMHPAGRVSPIQERQMTSVLDDNVHNIALAGSFDDCQRIMKTLAGDLDFKRRYSLGAVNSVNWARVMAQIVYYFSASLAVTDRTGRPSVRFCVPTGNFGNILAGWYAVRMGAPISQLVLATNENDILARFFNSGEYSLGQVHHTPAPAMDIQVASNFERYLHHKVGRDAERLRALMADFARDGALHIDPDLPGQVDALFEAAPATRADILAAIRRSHEQYDYVIDPHTACGTSVVESLVGALTAGGAGDES
ncbi:MAG: threonine synthase, partial [Phycisphaerae bacterium]|nr:threonine synthase [Phycisphaerae bacterium]